jgi:hypothetical protein
VSVSSSPRSANDPRLLYDPRLPTCLGCLPCPDYAACGGLRVARQLFDCTALCHCPEAERGHCHLVCPNHPVHYGARLREVGGWELRVDHASEVPVPRLPSLVPLVKNGNARRALFEGGVVALPLARLFFSKSGRPRFADREAVSRHFKLARATKLVIDSVGYDRPLEAYWARARGEGLPEHLRRLEPALMTVPNFSLFIDIPRPDNLYNMKRIVRCWEELAGLGIPTALHLNARTDRDWERWACFLKDHPQVTVVAFEFTSGSAAPDRADWYAQKLLGMPATIRRPLTLVFRGARRHLADFSKEFQHVVYISADPFVRTMKRRRLSWQPGTSARWEPVWTLEGQPLDELFAHNVQRTSEMIEHLKGAPRAETP